MMKAMMAAILYKNKDDTKHHIKTAIHISLNRTKGVLDVREKTDIRRNS